MTGEGPNFAEPPLEAWADALEAAAEGTRFSRICVLAETASTQDAAARLAAGRPGLIVCAGRQTAGRGRHGRKWIDTGGHGLAMTFVVDGGLDDRTLARAGGLAALRAAEAVLNGAGARLGLKWPNDVLAWGEAAAATAGAPSPDAGGVRVGPARKLAGVLVERRGGVALVGIGINVGQGPGDWPGELVARCISLAMLGGWGGRAGGGGPRGAGGRLGVACGLIHELDTALGLTAAGLDAAWKAAEVPLEARTGAPGP